MPIRLWHMNICDIWFAIHFCVGLNDDCSTSLPTKRTMRDICSINLTIFESQTGERKIRYIAILSIWEAGSPAIDCSQNYRVTRHLIALLLVGGEAGRRGRPQRRRRAWERRGILIFTFSLPSHNQHTYMGVAGYTPIFIDDLVKLCKGPERIKDFLEGSNKRGIR